MLEAKEVQSLVYGGTLLVRPDFDEVRGPAPPFVEEMPERDELGHAFGKGFVRYAENQILYGLRVASAAFRDNELTYSLEKWKFSHSLDSFTIHSVHPRHGQVFENNYELRRHQVNAAMAIVAAYSAIEELGLEIRASAERPRFQDGNWNPEVLDDLEDRLARVGIKPDFTIEWIQRGSLQPLGENLESTPLRAQPSDWSDGEEVNDTTMPLPEAIARASYLRNKVSAHKLERSNGLAHWLGPYEVFNVQNVARMLLLARTGLLAGSKDERLIISRDTLIRNSFGP